MSSSSYIGKSPQYGFFNKQNLTAPIGGSAITLDRTAADTRQLIVVVGGIIQEPETAYTINAAGSQITFTETPNTSLTGWIIYMGQLTTGPRIQADSLTSQTALGAQPATDDEFLLYDTSAGDLKKVDFSYLQSAMGDITGVTAGNGLTGGGTSGAVSLAIGAGTGITVNAGDIQVATNYAGGASIATVGTIATGVWQGTAIANAYIGTTIDATKLADGTVTNAEFQYINSLSSNAQTQLDAKASLTVAQEFTAQQNFNATTLTFNATQAWNVTTDQVTTVTLTANVTFSAPTNMKDGGFYAITVIQDGTGSRTGSWNAVFKWAGGTAPTLTTTASAKDIFVFRSDGTNMYEVGRQLNVS